MKAYLLDFQSPLEATILRDFESIEEAFRWMEEPDNYAYMKKGGYAIMEGLNERLKILNPK